MNQRVERNVEAGEVIAERYRIEAPIGHGAMGSVWRGVHLQLDSPVAIKFLNASIAGDPVMLERFMREARAAAAVRSSHVVQIFDHGVDAGVPYIAMELLVGETLDARLAARGALAPPEVDKIFGEIARAVGVAHELGVVHRDIKPANIFIAREGDHEVTKVLDFGIAKLIDRTLEAPAARTTDTGILLGTPHYMSPEQARGRPVDHRTDLWALAVLAFECLTGRHPFESETLGDLVVQICTGAPSLPSAVAQLPVALDRWFLRGVSKEPAERFGSIAEMASELHTLLAAEGLGAASRPRSEPMPRRLELVGTEVISDSSARRRAPGGSEPLNATAIAAEVPPRARQARRGRRALLVTLVLVAPLVSFMLQRRPTPAQQAGAHGSAAPVNASGTPGNGGAAPGNAGVGALSDTAAASQAGPVTDSVAGGTSATTPTMPTMPTTPTAPMTTPAPGATPTGATPTETTGATGKTPSEVAPSRAVTPVPPRAPPARYARPSRPPVATAPAHSAPRAGQRPVPAPAAEVARDPASVPPAPADPYADRL